MIIVSNCFGQNRVQKIFEINKFPIESNNNYYLASPTSVDLDLQNKKIIISDQKENCIIITNYDGVLLKRIGQSGEGPGDFNGPSNLAVFENGKIAVIEGMNRRLQIFNNEGKYLNIIRLFKTYKSCVINRNAIYAAPYLRLDSSDKIIDVLNYQGEVVNSFGEPEIIGTKLDGILNMTSICFGKGYIYSGFCFLPKIRKYNTDGKLIFSKEIDDKIFAEYGTYNVNNIGKSNRNEKVSYKPIFNVFKYYNEYIYSLRKNDNKIEIIEINEEGEKTNIYCYETNEKILISDLAVLKHNNMLRFYLLEISPNAQIHVLSNEQ